MTIGTRARAARSAIQRTFIHPSGRNRSGRSRFKPASPRLGQRGTRGRSSAGSKAWPGLAFALALAALVPLKATAALAGCTAAAVTGLNVPRVTVSSVTDVAASGPTPEYCSVAGAVATHGEGAGPGSAQFILKLPASWNGKFLFLGCGGNCGSVTSVSVESVDVAEALGLGYATVNTDTGHEQDPTTPDPTWVLQSPGVPNEPAIVDYQYRAVHQVTVAAKELVKGHYGGAISRAYFDGCSTGGRQGMIEANRYPDDYDGIIAGDPVSNHSNLDIADIKNAKAFLPPDAYIPFSLIPTIDAAVLAQCDGLDGTVDGLIQNPGACSFDFNSLVPTVLTKAQASGMISYLGQTFEQGGRPIFPGHPVGFMTTATFENVQENSAPAANPSAAEPWGLGKGPTAWSNGDSATRYFVEYNPTFDVNNDWPIRNNSIARSAFDLMHQRFGIGDASQPDQLDRFLAKGRKMLMYHGFADHLVSPWSSTWYYQALAGRHGGYDAVKKQVRLFMVPGMGHCSGGPGPNTFDTLNALDAWVTKGTPPDGIVAVNTGSGRSMPLCAFPEAARYVGGNTNLAASWACDAGDRRLLQIGSNGRLAGAGGGPPCAGCAGRGENGDDDRSARSRREDEDHDGRGDD